MIIFCPIWNITFLKKVVWGMWISAKKKVVGGLKHQPKKKGLGGVYNNTEVMKRLVSGCEYSKEEFCKWVWLSAQNIFVRRCKKQKKWKRVWVCKSTDWVHGCDSQGENGEWVKLSAKRRVVSECEYMPTRDWWNGWKYSKWCFSGELCKYQPRNKWWAGVNSRCEYQPRWEE
jgi:hypothetical protein